MTTRLEGDPLDARWRSAADRTAVVTIDLSPLSPADARSIARRFIDISSFADQCVERAGGNPLFLEQFLAARSTSPMEGFLSPFKVSSWPARISSLPKIVALSRQPPSLASASAFLNLGNYFVSRSTIAIRWYGMSFCARHKTDCCRPCFGTRRRVWLAD